jgi:hypothetical protein
MCAGEDLAKQFNNIFTFTNGGKIEYRICHHFFLMFSKFRNSCVSKAFACDAEIEEQEGTKNAENLKKAFAEKYFFIILHPITTMTDGVTVALQILVLSV